MISQSFLSDSKEYKPIRLLHHRQKHTLTRQVHSSTQETLVLTVHCPLDGPIHYNVAIIVMIVDGVVLYCAMLCQARPDLCVCCCPWAFIGWPSSGYGTVQKDTRVGPVVCVCGCDGFKTSVLSPFQKLDLLVVAALSNNNNNNNIKADREGGDSGGVHNDSVGDKPTAKMMMNPISGNGQSHLTWFC